MNKRLFTNSSFSEKFVKLDNDSQQSIIKSLSHIDAAIDNKGELLHDDAKLLDTSSNIYILTVNASTRLFVAIDYENKKAFLLDIIYEPNKSNLLNNFFWHSANNIPANKNPLQNTKLNPNFNSSINYLTNSKLNPVVNSRINPIVNSQINPLVNSNINPFVNSRYNYFINSRINPNINSSINPKINSSINPSRNRTFDGPFLYDNSLNRIGFIVRIDDDVIILFDMQSDFIGIGIKNKVDGFTTYDTKNNWTGHMIPDGQGGFLRFDKSNKYEGIMV